MAVGGQRDVEIFTAGGAEPGQLSDEIHNSPAQQRFAAGNAYLVDTERSENTCHAEVVCKRQVTVERALISGATVNTLIVAAIGDGDSQIGDCAAEFVGKQHAALGIQRFSPADCLCPSSARAVPG